MKKQILNKFIVLAAGWICLSLTVFLFAAGLIMKIPDAIAWGSLNTGIATAVLIWHGTRGNLKASKLIRLLMSLSVGLSLYVTLVWIVWCFGIGIAIGAVESGAIEHSYPAIAGSWVLSLLAYWGYRNDF